MELIQHFISDRGTVFQVFVYGLVIAYGYHIFINLFQLFQIWTGMSRLKRFIYGNRNHFYRLKRQMLLSYFPIISRYLGSYSDNLTYNDSYYQLREKAITMYKSMLSIRDYQKHELRGSFNPILGIKTFVTFPIVILSWFGIRPKSKNSFLISAIGWIIAYILGMFEPEIKGLIITLFKNLV